MKKVLAILAFAVMSLTASAQDAKWQFEGDPVEGMILVMDQNDKWGFLDEQHNVVVACIWDYAKDFAGGRAMVCRDEKYGYIDKTGRLVIPCKYAKAYDFSEGLAGVMDPMTGKYGFIDRTGRLVLPFKWQDVTPFENGWAEGVNAAGKSLRVNMPNGFDPNAEPTHQQQEETAKEIIISRINCLYEALAQQETGVDGRFACRSWLEMVAAVNKKDESEDIGFFNDDIWTWMQDENPSDLEARNIRFVTLDARKGTADVDFILHSSVQTVHLMFAFCCEDGDWRVHDITRFNKGADGAETSFSFRQSMKEYLGANDNTDYSSGDEYNKDLRSLVEGDD